MKGFLLIAVLLAGTVRADTIYNYTLTSTVNPQTFSFSWSLTGVPHTLPGLHQLDGFNYFQIGQPGDIEVTLHGIVMPSTMRMTANSLYFQCDPFNACLWDLGYPVYIDTDIPIISGARLLTGEFIGRGVQGYDWGHPQLLTVTAVDSPEPSPGTLVLIGFLLCWLLRGLFRSYLAP